MTDGEFNAWFHSGRHTLISMRRENKALEAVIFFLVCAEIMKSFISRELLFSSCVCTFKSNLDILQVATFHLQMSWADNFLYYNMAKQRESVKKKHHALSGVLLRVDRVTSPSTKCLSRWRRQYLIKQKNDTQRGKSKNKQTQRNYCNNPSIVLKVSLKWGLGLPMTWGQTKVTCCSL